MKGKLVGLLVLLFIQAVLVFPSLCVDGHYKFDEVMYHLPAIESIRTHWPALDLVKDCTSAISPGYHYVLAGISYLFGNDRTTLRVINAAISSLVPCVLFLGLARYVNDFLAFMFSLPLSVNNFFLKSSANVTTDNVGLLLALSTLLLVLQRTESRRIALVTGLSAGSAIFARQLHAWLMMPIGIGLVIECYKSGLLRSNGHFDPRALVSIKLVRLVLPLAIPVGVLCVLVHAWRGFVPPNWQDQTVKFTLAPLAYLLSVGGVVAFPYLFANYKSFAVDRPLWGSLAGCFLFGIFVAAYSPTSYSPENDRWGGYFYNVVKELPCFYDRSVFFLMFSPIGAVLITLIGINVYRADGKYEAAIWTASVLSWAATFLINGRIFHRYYEPMLIVFVAIGVALVLSKRAVHRCNLTLLYVFIAIQLAISLATIYAAGFLTPYRT